MNWSRLRLITFDVTDTLLRFRSAPGQQYGEIGAMFGVLADNNVLSDNIKMHMRKMIKEHPNYGLHSGMGWREWWKRIVKGTFQDSHYSLTDEKLNAIADHLIDAYKTSSCWQQCYGATGLLDHLKTKNLTLGIISNFDPRLREILENTQLLPYFKFLVTSYEAGCEKPNPEIFQRALEDAKLDGLKPEQCLHIGDKVKVDYVGAKISGWNGILVNEIDRNLLKKKHPEVEVEDHFENLYQLHKHIEREEKKMKE